MAENIEDLEPKAIWKNFAELSKVPRPSKKEERVVAFVKKFGENLGLETLTDEVGNIVIRKPATKGMENRKMVTLQSHVDMVHQKNNDVNFDFEKDAIQPYVEGDWVKARGTTLGADNGLGVATAMAVLQSKEIAHGPLEAVFTVDEETGMTGAFALKPGFLKGDILLNLDSEDEGELYIGCAGGVDTNVDWEYPEEAAPAGFQSFVLSVTGLQGGHSGMDINTGRGNSNKLMGRFLFEAREKCNLRLASFRGGTARNAIPRETIAQVWVASNKIDALHEHIKAFENAIKNELGSVEPDFKMNLEPENSAAKVMTNAAQDKFVNAVEGCPNAVLRMSREVEGLVETSTNLSKINLAEGKLRIESLQRSSIETARDNAAHTVGAVFMLIGAKVEHVGAYPGWKPNPHSEILEVMKKVYKDEFGKVPDVKAVHAGLECGIIGERYPNMELISFGPTIRHAHSPREQANIPSVKLFWKYLLDVLKNIPVKS